MGIGGQREGAEASVEKQYAHTNVIDTLEVTCTTGNRTRVQWSSPNVFNLKIIA